MTTSDNKVYHQCPVDMTLFSGSVKVDDAEYEVPVDILKKLSKSLGFSYDMFLSLASVDLNLASELIARTANDKSLEEITVLLDTEENLVTDYSGDKNRSLVLNSDFIKTVERIVSTSDEVKISSEYYDKKSTTSSIIVKKVAPVTVEETTLTMVTPVNYSVGVLLVNEESNGSYTRLVIYVDDQPLYLPASFYNSTAARFNRSTSSPLGALEVLALKVVEDLRDDSLVGRIKDLHYRYRYNKGLSLSYEEYNSLLKTIRKIPTVIDNEISLDSLTREYYGFENKYINMEEQKVSYLWRCTAVSSLTLESMLSKVVDLLNSLYAPLPEYYKVRELLGSYISTNRMVSEIAKTPSEE